jgi:DNA-binding transcriptional LysR family regulator
MQDLNWHDLRVVLAVTRFETAAEAARRLGVDETTVARRIARLERALGTRLVERMRGRLVATAAGERVAAHAERIEREVEALVGTASGADQAVAGTVRVTAVPILVDRVLIPALPAFVAAHPRLRLELIAEPRDLSLTKREADLALRLARPRREAQVRARRIGRLDYGVFGPTGCKGARRKADKLPWITYDDAMAGLPQARWMADRMKARGDTAAMLVANDAEAILQAVKAGLGKSLLPTVIGAGEPGLACLGGPAPELSREIWLLTHPELRDIRRVRTVTEWLVATIGALEN